MRIHSITLCNYRLYSGVNTIIFNEKEDKNIFLISGENGFGKTTFLHALLWCLYGRLMVDVDDSVKKELTNNGGYPSFLKNNLNRNSAQIVDGFSNSEISQIKKNGYPINNDKYSKDSIYYVSIVFSDVFIPSIPCRSLEIKRSYDTILDKECTEIFIDGQPNELSREIGCDVFINDFILNKDIARFFFFDSERIVTLAETNTLEEKRRLNSAYNEVLGVKKYEDLKKNLENLRLRFRRKSTDIEGRNKLIALLAKKEELENRCAKINTELSNADEAIATLQTENEKYQIELLREGNGMTIEELHRQEALLNTTQNRDREYKSKLKVFLDFAPFAIVGKLLKETKEQVDKDHLASLAAINVQNQNVLLAKISDDLHLVVNSLGTTPNLTKKLNDSILEIVQKYLCDVSSDECLINLNDSEYKEFSSIYSNITSTYKSEFIRLADDYRKNKQTMDKASRKIANMQSNESDSLIKSIRAKKNEIENQISALDAKVRGYIESKAYTVKELATTNKLISELSKTVSLDDSDLQKDDIAAALIHELDSFLLSLKDEKKSSLECRIKASMNSLMHKENFIGSVRVNISEETMDIELFSQNGDIIRKESLSKGEQQLYATSLLKALVDESGIQFPVFIDSPLQKFDKSHSNKIITEFYPSISKQVVLFPLLHKELTEAEYEVMKPIVNDVYLINNKDFKSYFKKIDIDALMSE